MMQNNSPRSMVDHAMQYGLWLGLLFIVNLATSIIATTWPPLLFLYIAGLCWVPILFFKLIKLYASKINYTPFLFSQLWSFGILMVIFASLLSGIVYYIFYQYIDPNYIPAFMEHWRELIIALRDSATTPEQREALQGAVIFAERAKTPTAIQFVFMRIWSNLFMGLLGGIFIALIVALQKRRKHKKDTALGNN